MQQLESLFPIGEISFAVSNKFGISFVFKYVRISLQQLIVQETWYINSVVHYVLKHVIQMKMKSALVVVLKDVSVPVEQFCGIKTVLILQNVQVHTVHKYRLYYSAIILPK